MRTCCLVTTALKVVLIALAALWSCSSEQAPPKAPGDAAKSTAAPSADTEQRAAEPGRVRTADSGTGSANRPPALQNARVKVFFESDMEVIRVFPEASDEDGDTVTFVYEWTKNGAPAGSGDSVSGIKRGDSLSVQVTPYDGKDYGKPKRLNTVIQNMSPRVIDVSTQSFRDNILTCLVKGFDPDGDLITYALVDPPQGVTIAKESGLLTWQMRADTKEHQSVTVKLTDGMGGEYLYPLTVTITEERGSVQPRAN